ncbi:MAG TPA: hydrogenase iron-sulfur subunit [Coriobacteriia bacterium]|nr:hydrogenase iron-sulfur subunit [Coriobacteriia bacterium]
MSVVNEAQTGVAAGTETFEPKILAFACHWCTYSGADLAGLNRMNYPANVRVLRVPCSGRVNPQYILTALNQGVDGVLVCGCHPGDCHYVSGNYYAKRRLMAFRRMLQYTGLEPERFQVRWISGSEAGKFRDTVTSVVEQIRAIGPYTPDPALAALIDKGTDAQNPILPESVAAGEGGDAS